MEINENGEVIVIYTDERGSVNIGKLPECNHVYSDWTESLQATCTSIGYNTRSCSICGDIDYQFIEKTGHKYGEWEIMSSSCEGAWKVRICKTCGTPQMKKIEGKHDYEGGICIDCGELQTKGLIYTLNDNGESYSVTGIGTCADTDIIIPSKYEGLPVTQIDYRAFYQNSSLTSVEIGDSVTTIGDFAFDYCAHLTSVVIGGSVTTIGNYAFSSCDSLTSVVIPDSVTAIDEMAFYCCASLTSVVIGGSVTTIGERAFDNCYRLTSVVIPDSVTTIGFAAFSGCSRLMSVEIGDSVTSIGNSAFDNCSSLTSVYYKGTMEEWNGISIGYLNGDLTNATRYYYSESEPTTAGNYWHYVNGEVVVWTKETV